MSTERTVQRDQAYQQLRPMLLHSQLAAGTRLGESEWAGKLNVHRGALREAFGLLAHEGLLQPGERGGHFVPTLERADLDDVLELRAALEVGTIRRLGLRKDHVDVSPLESSIETMRLMIEQNMPLGFAEADRRFHTQLIELAANARVTRAYHQAPVLISVNLEQPSSSRSKQMNKTLGEHETIRDHLAAGRFDLAADTLEQHLFAAHSAGAIAPLTSS